MELKKVSYKITSETPLLMHNGRLADPLGKFGKAMKKISSKRGKVDADFIEMARLEFFGGMYTENEKLIIPGEVIEAVIIAGAKNTKKGKVATAGVFCRSNPLLVYDGEQDVTKRFDDESCRKTCGVKIGGARIMRTRPFFKEWSADITVEYNPETVDLDDLKTWVEQSGKVGIMDWRPKFGLFTVSKWAEVEV